MTGDLGRRAVGRPAVAQKNDAEQSLRADTLGSDRASPGRFRECGAHRDVDGTPVVEIECSDQPPGAFEQACTLRGPTV